MLGTVNKSPYKSLEDFCTSSDYLKYMYGNTQGLITRSTINEYYSEDFNRTNILIKRRYDKLDNVYTSMNTFFKPNRETINIKKLNALYVDIDCYKLNMSKESVLMELYDYFFGSKLPYPTFVIDSGRGLYLIWKINEDRNALPRWTSVMNYILETCKPFNADPACQDASRVLRVPFSLNTKSNSMVKILDFFDAQYTLHEIIKEYEIKPVKHSKIKKNTWGKATPRMKLYSTVIAEQKNIELPDFNNYEETFNFISENKFKEGETAKEKDGNMFYFATSNKKPMLNGRLRDLEKLFSMRKGGNCKRELALFLYRLWLCEATSDYEYALNMTLLFNSRLDSPHSEKYVIAATSSAEKIVKKGKTYKYSKARIIELLEITEEEMKEMNYLTVTEIAMSKDSKKVRNRRAYLTRLESEGKKTKSEIVKIRQEKITELILEGKEKSEICTLLNISKRTFERDMITIKSLGLIEKIKERLEEAIKKAKTIITSKAESAKNATSIVATKIQPPYYKRTSEGCSAPVSLYSLRGTASVIQLSLWDYFTLHTPTIDDTEDG